MVSARSNRSCHLTALLCLSLLLPVGVVAEEVDLFNPQRGAPPPEAEPAKPPPPPPVARPKPRPPQGGKPFVLRGTSKIASRYAATLQTPTGGDVTIRWRPGEVVGVPGFAGYEISSVSPREARLRYPENAQCNDDLALGVQCAAGGGAAVLSLARRNAKAAPKPLQTAAAPNQVPQVNPFQAALERAKAGNTAAPPVDEETAKKQAEHRAEMQKNFGNFKPKTINPEEVPAGMKVVHTPFGDRLVPEK